MKYMIYLVGILLTLSASIHAQEGTHFEDLTLQEALTKAQASGKKVFVDCYTKTCGPCKYMVKFIFPRKECGDYFNAHYVCIMKDMEEGEGIEIAREYDVRVYPTYLILNQDGSLYCRMDGGAVSKPEDDFVQKVKLVVELTELNKKYVSGSRDKTFLEKYLSSLQVHDKNRWQKVLGETLPLLGVEKLCEPDNWNSIKTEIINIDSPLFRYMIDHREACIKLLGRPEVEQLIMANYVNEFRIYKLMGIDYEKRIADLKLLEKDHYKGTRPLRYAMLFRQIIDNTRKERVNEILAVLQQLSRQIPDEEEQLKVVQELNGFERVADRQQKEKARALLTEIGKKLQPDHTMQLERIATRVTR